MRYDLALTRLEAICDRIRHDFPELEDDDLLRLDTLDGETDAKAILRKLVEDMSEADAYACGIEAHIENMAKRKARYVRRVEYHRALIDRVMDAIGQTKVELDIATLSKRPAPTRVVIADEEAIPDTYWRTKREPNKTAIKDALRDGVTIPGAFLSNGEPALSVRMT